MNQFRETIEQRLRSITPTGSDETKIDYRGVLTRAVAIFQSPRLPEVRIYAMDGDTLLYPAFVVAPSDSWDRHIEWLKQKGYTFSRTEDVRDSTGQHSVSARMEIYIDPRCRLNPKTGVYRKRRGEEAP